MGNPLADGLIVTDTSEAFKGLRRAPTIHTIIGKNGLHREK